MRIVIQRVSEARVEVGDRTCGEIGVGLLIFLGIEQADDEEDIDWLVKKIVRLRVLSDELGRMNLDLAQAGGAVLLVSQFTLHAATRKGNRPSFIRSADPVRARALYDRFVACLREASPVRVETGEFAADMRVHLVNDGPATLIIDSRARE